MKAKNDMENIGKMTAAENAIHHMAVKILAIKDSAKPKQWGQTESIMLCSLLAHSAYEGCTTAEEFADAKATLRSQFAAQGCAANASQTRQWLEKQGLLSKGTAKVDKLKAYD